MKQYLTLEICDYTGTVEHFLRTRSGLTGGRSVGQNSPKWNTEERAALSGQ